MLRAIECALLAGAAAAFVPPMAPTLPPARAQSVQSRVASAAQCRLPKNAAPAQQNVFAAAAVAYAGLSRPVKFLLGVIVLGVAGNEIKKRRELIASADACMDGDADECAVFDSKVAETAAWKLSAAQAKLPMTNALADKLGGAPAGSPWAREPATRWKKAS
jgi:hypothetical protein